MATGQVLNIIEDNFFEVEITRYSAGAIQRANGFRLDQDRSGSIVSQYELWLDQKRARLDAVAAEKLALTTQINQEKPKPVKSVDPLNPADKPDSFYKNEGVLSYAEMRVPVLESIEVSLNESIHAFDQIRSRERLRHDSFKLDAERLEAGLDLAWVENIWARDCSMINVNDVVLVISLDFEGKQWVLDPDPIETDYVAELNQAWLSHAVSVRVVASLGNQIEVLNAWLSDELAKPSMPGFPHQNPENLRVLETARVNTQKGIEYRQPLLKSYQNNLIEDPESDQVDDWVSAINTLHGEIQFLSSNLIDIENDLENEKALPEMQVGQYQDSALIQNFENQIQTIQNQINDALYQKEQTANNLELAKNKVLSGASDTIKSGYRSVGQVNVLSSIDSQSPAQWFANAALIYGAQKWNPFFITGDVIEAGDLIKVAPDEVTRLVGKHEIDVTPLDLKTPFTISAGVYDYEVGDKALINVKNTASKELEPFGWVSGIRPCGVYWPMGYFEKPSALPVDEDYFQYAPDIEGSEFKRAFLTMDGRFSWREVGSSSVDSIWRLYDLDMDTGFFIEWTELFTPTVRDLPNYFPDARDAEILYPTSKSGLYVKIASKYKDSGAYQIDASDCYEMWEPPVRAFDYYYLSISFPEKPGLCSVSMQFLGGWGAAYSASLYPAIEADYNWIDFQLLYNFDIVFYPISKTKSVLIKRYSSQVRNPCSDEDGFYGGSYATRNEVFIFDHASKDELFIRSETFGGESVSTDHDYYAMYGLEISIVPIKVNCFRMLVFNNETEIGIGYLLNDVGDVLDSSDNISRSFNFYKIYHGKYVINFKENETIVFDLIGRMISKLPGLVVMGMYAVTYSLAKGYGVVRYQQETYNYVYRLFRINADGLGFIEDNVDVKLYGDYFIPLGVFDPHPNAQVFRGWLYKLKNP